ncbi:MAG TPA: DUF1003 domain-containing protein [Bryobacteraceae bacterium]|jgi:uncharacterized membrane protein|nr:DUF1003 domain-containing protein [Bryobacteraceae bacterium]
MRRKSKAVSSDQTVRRNILEIGELEKTALDQRSRGERIGDSISQTAGKMWFIALHAVWFSVWMAANLGLGKKFDPFPFPFLTLVVSLEAIFLSLFILVSQNRASRQSEARAHLDLQVNLLAELEATKMLQLLRALCAHNGLPEADDPEVKQLVQRTEPKRLVKEIRSNMPEV